MREWFSDSASKKVDETLTSERAIGHISLCSFGKCKRRKGTITLFLLSLSKIYKGSRSNQHFRAYMEMPYRKNLLNPQMRLHRHKPASFLHGFSEFFGPCLQLSVF